VSPSAHQTLFKLNFSQQQAAGPTFSSSALYHLFFFLQNTYYERQTEKDGRLCPLSKVTGGRLVSSTRHDASSWECSRYVPRRRKKKNRCAYFVDNPYVTVTLHCSPSDGFPTSQRRSRGMLLHRSHAMTHTKFCRTLWPTAKTSPDKTQHSQERAIHGSGGIRNGNSSK
jgi:hypothetical protein